MRRALLLTLALGASLVPQTATASCDGIRPTRQLVGRFTKSVSQAFDVVTMLDATRATFIAGTSNRYPLKLLGSSTDACLNGGTILGTYDRTWSWKQMHDTYNNAGVRVALDGLMVEGLQIENVTDGVRALGRGWVVADSRMRYIRDDAIEADTLTGGVIRDVLIDGTYMGFSARPSPSFTGTGAGEVTYLDGVLVRLQAMPGPDKGPSPGHGAFFKLDRWDDPAHSRSPRYVIRNSIFMAEQVGFPGVDRMGLPPAELVRECSNNQFLWLGSGPPPGRWPSNCVQVLMGPTARAAWDAAVRRWKDRHGDTD